MGTDDNLRTAFTGESRAFMKYLSFAVVAEKEGHWQAAKLFRALAESERVHAQSHLMVLGEVGETDDNVSSAIDSETYEFTQMYPSFINQGEKEGNQRAVIAFRNAMASEKTHANLLSALMDRTAKDSDYYVCSACGQTLSGNVPEKCPTCGAAGQKFTQVN